MSPILHKKTFQELITDELYELFQVRSEVFVVEQNCVYQDLDGDGQQSLHLWLTNDLDERKKRPGFRKLWTCKIIPQYLFL